MAIINSVGNLLGAVNSKADALTSAAKGILCIPSILSQFPDIAKGIVGTLTNTVVKELTNIVGSIQNVIENSIENAISSITGVISSTLSSVLQIVATIKATVSLVEETLAGFKTRIQDVKDFINTKENCKFAGASLLKCIIGNVTQDITKKVATNLSTDRLSLDSFINNTTSKLASPQGVIIKYTQKVELSVNRAANQINATSLI
jgi:prophage DNA circulation protein